MYRFAGVGGSSSIPETWLRAEPLAYSLEDRSMPEPIVGCGRMPLIDAYKILSHL